MPSSAALIAASVPVKVMAASSAPSPPEKVNPAVLASVSVPWLAVSVTATGLEPASESPTEIALPFVLESTSAVPCTVVCGPGTKLIGALFTPSRLTTDTSAGSSPSYAGSALLAAASSIV